MKKGFTLIELLAVIVILAIIALIATPIILNIIADTKESSNERNIELYISSLQTEIARKNLNEDFNPNYCVIVDKILNCDGVELKIVENDFINEGEIYLENGKVIGYSFIINDKYYYGPPTDPKCFISFNDGEINDYLEDEPGCPAIVIMPSDLVLKKSRIVSQTFNYDKCVESMLLFNPTYSPELVGPLCASVQNDYKNLPEVVQFAISDVVYELTDDETQISKIGGAAFFKKQLKTVILSNDITEVGAGAFFANNLKNVTIPPSVTTIMENGFNNNPISFLNLKYAWGLTYIGESAFANNKISMLDLNDAVNLTTIDKNAFYENLLTSITIPSNITFVGEWAFQNNLDLTSLIIEGSNRTQDLNVENLSFGDRITSLIINTNPVYLTSITNDILDWDKNTACKMQTDGDLSTSSCVTINN